MHYVAVDIHPKWFEVDTQEHRMGGLLHGGTAGNVVCDAQCPIGSNAS